MPTASATRIGRSLRFVYRFALRPRWLLSHLFVIALIVTLVNLGLWQWGKYQDRLVQNRVTRAHLAAPVVDLGSLLKPTDSFEEAKGLQNRTVRVTGSFDGAEQILVRGRSLDSSPGSWVLTPLREADGTIAVVNRGWIPNDGRLESVPADYAPPRGAVTVTGLIQPTVVRERIGATDPPTGRLTNLARPDIARIAKQVEGPVVPAWIQLRTTEPAGSGSAKEPRVLGPPELDNGPYFSYTVQWFIFSAIALIGYPLILRRNARDRSIERQGRADDFASGEPAPTGDALSHF